MNENESTKKYLLYIGLAALIMFLIAAFLGRLEFHNELEQEVLPHTLLGYVDDVQYTGDVVVTSDEWPEWAMEYDKPEEAMIHFTGEASGGHIGIFADLIYYENRYERRTWFSGRLLERASEYYYKPEGALYLEAVYEPGKVPEMSITDMVPQNYDFMAFDGR
ncbi:MAG: hypothetical protein J6C02_05325 [Peptococcaceae bacterium]|nr:hypothetical protein [Peptococcaceae bacterium]MBO5115540.1 hypothetical protein [Peptococcaceae bacterium]MBO5140931.1 hypothetical protein [Peptococcaceae bacterium]